MSSSSFSLSSLSKTITSYLPSFSSSTSSSRCWPSSSTGLVVGVCAGVVLGAWSWSRLQVALSPFRRGVGSRSADSPVHDAAYAENDAPAHHFYTAPFQFIQLSRGRVRYVRLNSKAVPNRPTVVLVHGFSIACDIWKQQADYLHQKGYDVLSFDNYGRGYSDAPDVANEPALYVGQLAELLFALRITLPIDLLGVSMGGAIVSHFAATYPSAINRLLLMCPAGLPVKFPPIYRLLAYPLVGEWLFNWMAPRAQDRGAAVQWEHTETSVYRAWKSYALSNIKHHDGFVRCLLSTLRHFPMGDLTAVWRRVVAQRPDLPILIMWGSRDGLTPYSNAQTLRELLPNSRLCTINNAKHNMMIERGEQLAQIIEQWLSTGEAPEVSDQ